MIKMVVFDIAGTTVDEDNVVYKTLRSTINAHGYDYSLNEVLEMGAGQEKLSAIKTILKIKKNETDTEKVAEALEIFEEFKKNLKINYSSMEGKEIVGASKVFASLRENDVLVVLSTGYDRNTAESLLGKMKWKVGSDIDALITASDVKRYRPNPDMIQLAMKKFSINSPAKVAKIGDSAIDVEEGVNARCKYTFGITTGAQTRSQMEEASPYKVVDSLQEMLDEVLSINNK